MSKNTVNNELTQFALKSGAKNYARQVHFSMKQQIMYKLLSSKLTYIKIFFMLSKSTM